MSSPGLLRGGSGRVARIATVVCALVVGALIVYQTTLALALAAIVVFILLWVWRPLYVLVVPAFWAVMADPVFLKLTGAAGQNSVSRVLDGWTALALIAAVVTVFSSGRTKTVLRDPAAIGVLLLWGCFGVAQMLGGNHLDAEKYWQGEVRALIFAGWMIVILILAMAPRATPWIGRLLAVMTGVAVTKGLVYWVFGIGIYQTTNGYFRLFGSEEATIGLFALAIGLANLARSDSGRNRTLWLCIFGGGAGLLVLSSLRAYWGFALLAILVVWVLEARLGMATSFRLFIGLVTGTVLGVLVLRYVATSFYSQAVASRLQTLLSGDFAGDASFGYRIAELAGVVSAVDGRWLFGAGFGSIQRTALSLFVGDAALEQTLLRYVHNSLLWAFLKSGLLGVAGVIVFYWGMMAASLKGASRTMPPVVVATSVGTFAALVALVGTDFFNAHLASPRYMIILSFAVAYAVAQASTPVAESSLS